MKSTYSRYDFSIIIVSWNTALLLQQCIESIYHHTQHNSFEIIVVDNASTDNTPHIIQTRFPEVHLIVNKENYGFAKANNMGIRASQGQTIVLLNPDTLFLNDVLAEFTKIFDKDYQAGIIGPKLLTSNLELQRWSKGNTLTLWTAFNHYLFLSELFPGIRFFAGIVDNSDYQYPTEVEWVSGACLAVRREVIAQIGLLDESIFMYSEDVDWCYRAKQAGYKIIYLPTAQVQHFGSQSMQKQNSELVLAAPLLNQDKFYQKLYGRKNLFFFRLIVTVGTLLRVIYRICLSIGQKKPYNNYRLQEARRNFFTAFKLLFNQIKPAHRRPGR